MPAKESANFVNKVQGTEFEEPNLEQVLDFIGVKLDYSKTTAEGDKNPNYGRLLDYEDSGVLMNPYEKIVPRVSGTQFNYASNGNSIYQNLNVSAGIALKQEVSNGVDSTSYTTFHSPMDTIFATMTLQGRDGIKTMLGRGIDDLSAEDEAKIDAIDKYLYTAEMLPELREVRDRKIEQGDEEGAVILGDLIRSASHVERKRLNDIHNAKQVSDETYCGEGYNAKVPSKVDGNYEVTGQQFVEWHKFLVSLKNHKVSLVKGYETILPNEVTHELTLPYVPISFDIACTCGKFINSKEKYEGRRVMPMCSHIELKRQTEANPSIGGNINLSDGPEGNKIDSLDSIFTPFNLDNPEKGSSELRSILRNVLYAFIVPQENSIKLDFDDSKNARKSNGYTLFKVEADAALIAFKEIYNPKFLKLMNAFYNEKYSVEQTCYMGFGENRETGEFAEVKAAHSMNKNNKLEHRLNTINGRFINVKHCVKENDNYVPLTNNQYAHDPNTMEHVKKDYDLKNRPDLEIVHVTPKFEHRVDFMEPFKFAVFPNCVTAYPMFYKMNKVIPGKSSKKN